MDESLIILLVGTLVVVIAVLPIVAFVRTLRIGRLENRIAGLEAALLRLMQERASQPSASAVVERETVILVEEAAPEPASPQPIPESTEPQAAAPPAFTPAAPGPRLEEIIGERWLGWVGIAVLLFGAAFALKYAFENRWIGELGRVIIGVAVGMGFLAFGWQRHRAGWQTFGQIFTAGGVTLIYLAIYASYGFYQLIAAGPAFAFLAVVVIQTHLLAVAYRAPAIALMGQIGGFLTPVLLSTGRDQYAILFSYIALLDAGAALVCFLRNWSWVASASFVFTQILFWGWYDTYYHPEKFWAAFGFQLVVFLLFAAADLAPAARGMTLRAENWIRLFANPFVFFAAGYAMIDRDHPAWAGAFALVLAAVYAGLAQWAAGARSDKRITLALVGVALLFVTLAIPIQLEAHWITLAWAVQGAILAWISVRLSSAAWRAGSLAVFALAVFRYLAFDTPWNFRAVFTPVVNAYFLSGLALAVALGVGAWLLRAGARREAIGVALAAMFVTWFATTAEIYSYVETLQRETGVDYTQQRNIQWFGHMTASVVWALYASLLVGVGLRAKLPAARWAGLALFAVTVLKAFFVDIPVLEGIYRVAALIALGILLLAAGWGYQRIRRSSEIPVEEGA
jgi:uncharacterized membrane protein